MQAEHSVQAFGEERRAAKACLQAAAAGDTMPGPAAACKKTRQVEAALQRASYMMPREQEG